MAHRIRNSNSNSNCSQFLAILQFIALHLNFTIKTHGPSLSHIISFWPSKYGHCLAVCVCMSLCLQVCVCEIVMDIATYIYRMRVCYNFKHLTFVLVQQAKRATLHVCPARGLAWLLIICKQQHCCCCRCHDCDCCCCCRVECLLLSELPMRAICILINVAATCNKWK